MRRKSPDPIAAKHFNKMKVKMMKMFILNHKTGKIETAFEIFCRTKTPIDAQ